MNIDYIFKEVFKKSKEQSSKSPVNFQVETHIKNDFDLMCKDLNVTVTMFLQESMKAILREYKKDKGV